jgi:hypothetical protein
MKKILGLLFLLFVLSSHELFMKSDTYFLEENTEAVLYLFNGTFDQSENIITRDRIINPKMIGPGYSFIPAESDYFDKGDITYLKIKTGRPGTYVAGISTLPRPIELTGEEFTEYLEHEGLSDVLALRESEGMTNKPARELYAKHVKSLLQVGEKRSKHFTEELGYPTEFIPVKNPYSLKTGDEMSFLLKYKGKALTNQVVHCSSRQGKEDKEGSEMMLRTDSDGKVSFTINRSGHWYVATIVMVDSDQEEYDYESNWATLTFEVR